MAAIEYRSYQHNASGLAAAVYERMDGLSPMEAKKLLTEALAHFAETDIEFEIKRNNALRGHVGHANAGLEHER